MAVVTCRVTAVPRHPASDVQATNTGRETAAMACRQQLARRSSNCSDEVEDQAKQGSRGRKQERTLAHTVWLASGMWQSQPIDVTCHSVPCQSTRAVHQGPSKEKSLASWQAATHPRMHDPRIPPCADFIQSTTGASRLQGRDPTSVNFHLLWRAMQGFVSNHASWSDHRW